VAILMIMLCCLKQNSLQNYSCSFISYAVPWSCREENSDDLEMVWVTAVVYEIMLIDEGEKLFNIAIDDWWFINSIILL